MNRQPCPGCGASYVDQVQRSVPNEYSCLRCNCIWYLEAKVLATSSQIDKIREAEEESSSIRFERGNFSEVFNKFA
jgi:hypothetical protein